MPLVTGFGMSATVLPVDNFILAGLPMIISVGFLYKIARLTSL
jgi:hypothetical protein